jgi:hypothetical protein
MKTVRQTWRICCGWESCRALISARRRRVRAGFGAQAHAAGDEPHGPDTVGGEHAVETDRTGMRSYAVQRLQSGYAEAISRSLEALGRFVQNFGEDAVTIVDQVAIAVLKQTRRGTKQSSLGREVSKYGIEEFIEVKYLCVRGIES